MSIKKSDIVGDIQMNQIRRTNKSNCATLITIALTRTARSARPPSILFLKNSAICKSSSLVHLIVRQYTDPIALK